MNWIQNKTGSIVNGMQEAVRDDVMRKELMFKWLNILLALVSFIMTVVNIFTKEYILMISTLLFSVVCIVNVALVRRDKKRERIIHFLFAVESIALLAFFLISGIPNGFSALWMCLIPSFSLLIFGIRSGTLYSMITFSMLIFFFWIPLGRGLLMYRYTDEFMLRFPLFFIACYLLALFVELVRAQTQRLLIDSEHKYYYLSRHDALTGLYNRYGFNMVVDADFEDPKPESVAVMIIDIDDFKGINDRYGHSNGDIVLKGIAEIMRVSFCQKTRYCRWGGEEFTVYFHCEHDYLELAERFRRNVENTKFGSGDTIMQVTVSAGLCITSSMETAGIARLVNTADQCLYEAKAKGKNCIVSKEI